MQPKHGVGHLIRAAQRAGPRPLGAREDESQPNVRVVAAVVIVAVVVRRRHSPRLPPEGKLRVGAKARFGSAAASRAARLPTRPAAAAVLRRPLAVASGRTAGGQRAH
eukprot:1312428-Prymnesium_polylepis.1